MLPARPEVRSPCRLLLLSDLWQIKIMFRERAQPFQIPIDIDYSSWHFGHNTSCAGGLLNNIDLSWAWVTVHTVCTDGDEHEKALERLQRRLPTPETLSRLHVLVPGDANWCIIQGAEIEGTQISQQFSFCPPSDALIHGVLR